MIDPIGTAQLIFDISRAIYNQVQLAQANKNQCQTLAHRVQTVTSTLQGLMQDMQQEAQLRLQAGVGGAAKASPPAKAAPVKALPAKQFQPARPPQQGQAAGSPSTNMKYHNYRFQAALDDLHACLNDSLTYIQKYSKDSSWFKQVFHADDNNQAFASLNQRLGDAVNQLSLGITVQNFIDKKQDQQDQLKDQQDILARQDEILALNKTALTELQAVHLDQSQQHLVLKNQIASMMQVLQQIAQHKTKEKPPIKNSINVRYFDITFDKVIGKGSFGTIYLGKWFEQPVAVKTIEQVDINENDKKQFIHEVRTMSRLRCNTITQMYGACLEPGRAFLLMEYMENGSLFDAIAKCYHELAPERKHRIALDIARGLFYIHSQGVLHRDLKSANVLLNSDWHGKLTDFGLSKTQTQSLGTVLIEEQENKQWQAPEVLLSGKRFYTTASDIYSYGVILWELFTGKKPYAAMNEQQLIEHLKAGLREVISKDIPEAYANIIRRCWSTKPADRPNLLEIIHILEGYQIRPASPSPERLFEEGQSYEKQRNYVKAAACYERAVQKGHAKAMRYLGVFALTGKEGVPQDKQKAFKLLTDAANTGDIGAMANLGRMLEKGDGVPANRSQALYWYEQAAKSGDDWAKTRYATLSLRG